MSPRLPRPSRSERRMTRMSGFLARGDEFGGVDTVDGGALEGQRGLFVRALVAAGAAVTAAAVATFASSAGAGRGDALGVREERHLAGNLDGVGDFTLLLQGVAGDATVADLAAIAHEAREQIDVFVVD